MWWKNAVIYEVYVDKFAVDFKKMIVRLDYLKNLGINCIWLLPHYPSPMKDGGYDVSDYMNVRPDLGTLEDFKNFIQEAHGKGIRVIIDFVLNHISIEHQWFKEASASLDNPRRNYFLWSKTGREFSLAYNPFSHMTEGNWIWNDKTGDYYYATFFKEQADLNWDNPEVFDEAIKIIDFWSGLGVDGFRLDAVGHLVKREGTDCHHLPEVHGVLKKIRKHIDSKPSPLSLGISGELGKNPDVILLAETSGSTELVKPYFGDGDECHMAFNFPLMAATYLAIKNNDPSLLRKIEHESSGIPDNCRWATFIANHDEINLSSIESGERAELISWLDPENKYGFKGGGGVSMRLATIFNGDKEKILNMFRILFSLPGSPVIYYGSEIGMKNLELPEPPVDTRLYVRGNFDWQEAEKQLQDKNSLLNRLAKIIKNR